MGDVLGIEPARAQVVAVGHLAKAVDQVALAHAEVYGLAVDRIGVAGHARGDRLGAKRGPVEKLDRAVADFECFLRTRPRISGFFENCRI
jgi:hypothetical protein